MDKIYQEKRRGGTVRRSPCILGIDPGLSGGIAVVSGSGHLYAVHDMPVQVKFVSRSRRRYYDTHAFVALIKRLQQKFKITSAAVERVGASPQMGVSSAFSFGHGYGIIHGVLEACGISIIPVEPSVWKRGLGKDKSNAVYKARETFMGREDLTATFPTSKDGRAEAALIAWHVLNVEAW